MSSPRVVVKLCLASTLGVTSVVFQALPPLIVTPWQMRIDLVAVPWVLAWMLMDVETALISILISFPFVGYIGLGGGWIGATMKSIASVWMFLIPASFAVKLKKERILGSLLVFISVGLLAILIRDLTTSLANLYFAIPLFFGLTPQQTIEFFSDQLMQSPITRIIGLYGLAAYFFEICFWNTVQGIIDLIAALTIFKVIRRYGLIKKLRF